jgi:uncharacterized delta-60 repeat protein
MPRFLGSTSVATVLTTLALASPAPAAPSDLDRTFGTFGRAFPTGIGAVKALIPISDGRVIGMTSTIIRMGGAQAAIFRITRSGAMDTTFGSNGTVGFADTASSGAAAADAIVRQPDGGLVVLGGNPFGRPQFVLARYFADGTLDSTFGNQGSVESNAAFPQAMAVQADGALVVAVSPCSTPSSCGTALVRYDAKGVLDQTFGGSGAVRLPFVGTPALAVARDGRVVAAGPVAPERFGVARFRADGTPDPAFGAAGIAQGPPRGLVSVPRCLLVQSDGKVVVCARDTRTRDSQSWLVRFRADGSLDRGFGVRGAARMQGIAVLAVTRQSNGKLVAVGDADLGTVFATLRFRADGHRDRGFGRRGRLLTDLDPDDNISQAPLALAIGRDSRIIVGGGLGFPDYHPVIVRYKGGPSTVGGPAAKGRYVVRATHTAASGLRGNFHRDDLLKLRLEDRRGRTQRYDVCFRPPPLGTGSCRTGRTGSSVILRRLPQAGRWTLRFRIRATGEVILHTLRVYAPSR